MELDNEFKITKDAKASMVSVVCPNFSFHSNEKDTIRSLEELKELLRTLGIKQGSHYFQNKKSIEPATVLGSGKLKEIAEAAREEGSNLLVFDFELSAGQIRNIKKLTEFDVADRNHVILEIFSKHATTKQSKIQIEIARLQYLLPRLAGLWGHFSKQKGGIGIRGGEGEQQIELDRRIVQTKIDRYKKELKEIKVSRIEQRKRRKKEAVTAAIVGYTNAGKSSLLNRLCKVNVLEEDKLFATLDSTYRMLNPDSHPPMILVDTVGFISNLPNTLIDGFKTTLESAIEADVLLIACDISDPHYKNHLKVTQEVLIELGVEKKKQIIIFNKIDNIDPMKASIIKRAYPSSFLVSTFNKDDMSKLREYIINYFLSQQGAFDLFIPYEKGEAHSKILAKTNVIKTTNHETGIYYKIRVPDFIFLNLGLTTFVLSPGDDYFEEE